MNRVFQSEMDVELVAVYSIERGTEHKRIVVEEIALVLQAPDINFTLLQDVHNSLYNNFPCLPQDNYCLYWRYSKTKWVPIYNYITYKAAVSMMGGRRLYLVILDSGETQSLHPRYTTKSRPRDEQLLREEFPGEERSAFLPGYTLDKARQMKNILKMLRGVPKPTKLRRSMLQEEPTTKRKSKLAAKDGENKNNP